MHFSRIKKYNNLSIIQLEKLDLNGYMRLVIIQIKEKMRLLLSECRGRNVKSKVMNTG